MNDQPHIDPGNDAPLPRPGSDDPTVPATTVPVERVPVAEPTSTTPVATTTTEPPRRGGVLVPAWILFGVGGLLLLLIGGLVGYAIGDHDGDRHDRSVGFVRPGRATPDPGNFGPFGNGGRNGNGNGGGRNGNGVPSTPCSRGAFLGVAVQDSTNPKGAELVRVVAGSSAAKAGLKSGDVVTAVDGRAVSGAAAMTTRIRAHSPGDTVELTSSRGGQSKTVTVTLGDRNATGTQ